MTLVEAVSHERGLIDLDTTCLAELKSYYWALIRRNKFQAIHRARVMKTKHKLVASDAPSKESLAKRGLTDVGAFAEFFSNCGIPVAFAS